MSKQFLKYHDVRFAKDAFVGDVFKADGNYYEILTIIPLHSSIMFVISDLEPVGGLRQIRQITCGGNYLLSVYTKVGVNV